MNLNASVLPTPPGFAAGGGAMGERIRQTDWAATPLGSPGRWPQSLHTAVRMMLAARQPACIWWGSRLINLYNDACSPLLAGRHAQPLAAPASEVWRECWPMLAARVSLVIRTHAGVVEDALRLVATRNYRREEMFLAFSCTPVPDDLGGVGGVFCTMVDETDRVRSARRLSLIQELALRTSSAPTPEDACASSAACLTAARSDVPFAAIYLRDAHGALALAATTGIAREHPALPREVAPGAASAWPFAAVLKGRKALVSQLDRHLPAVGGIGRGETPQQAIMVPIRPRAAREPCGVLLAALSPWRPLDAEYRGLLEQVAALVGGAILAARDRESERQRVDLLSAENQRLVERACALQADNQRLQAGLARSEQHQQDLLHALPAAVCVTDRDGQLTGYSEAAAALWGRRPELGVERWCGSQRMYRVDGQPLPSGQAPAARALAGEEAAVTAEIVIERPDGSRRRVLAQPRVLHDAGGAVSGAVTLLADVTASEQARDTEREAVLLGGEPLYRAIGESLDYGIWVCDAQGRNLYASESFLRLVGLTQEQYAAVGWRDLLHPDDVERTLATWRECLRSGATWEVEHRCCGADGKLHPILSRGLPVRGQTGKVIGWAGVNLDISRLKRVETELRQEGERKNEFLATLAHELRNPLAPIRSSLDLMRLSGGVQGFSEAQQIMERQMQNLVRLVDDLTEMSRITRGNIELRRVRLDLASAIATAVETCRPAMERAGHDLRLALPPAPLPVDADPVRLAQIFANLLNNAAKYTDDGGRITLEVTLEEGWAVASVRDTGMGIPPDLQGKVFDLFCQVDRTLGRAKGGLGIGLALVRRLLDMHGGTIEVRSAGLGAGSEFLVRLPLAGPPAGQCRDEGAPQAAPLQARRVLVVDDNADAADSMSQVLRALGLEVRVVHQSEAALALAEQFMPDVALLDIGMPGMDGYELARRLRRASDANRPVLVALTGWAQPDDRRRVREAGFDHHLVKPASVEAVLAVLASL